MNKLRILYITHYPLLYGANRSLLNTIDSVEDSVYPIVITPEEGPICELLAEKNIKYYIVPFAVPFYFKQKISPLVLLKMGIKMLIYPFLFLISLLKMYRIAKDNQIQIIHSNTGLITVGYTLSRLMGLKHVWHLREFQDKDYNLFPYPFQRVYIRKLYSKSAVICVSKTIAGHFSVDVATALYDPISIDHVFDFRTREKKDYFLFCGLVHKNKGIENLIKTFGTFNQSHPGYQLYVLGTVDDAYKDYLTGLARSCGCEENVLFFGSRNDVFEFMQKARALIMSSTNEAMGRVTIEAMFSKCVVIGYNNAGTAELIDHGTTGLLYDNDEELLCRMEYVLTNEKDVIRIEETAYAYAESNFTEKVYAESIMKIYENLR